MDEKYNGWTNRETWLVNLWIENERESHFYWKERTKEILEDQPRDQATRCLANVLEEWCEELEPKGSTLFADLMSAALGRVDWFEIAESMIANAQQESPFGPVIYAYTRQQALADGVLKDAGKLAAEAGFRVPVALTSAVWEAYVRAPEAVPWQDETGRLWDILTMLRHAIRGDAGGNETQFGVFVQNDEAAPQLVTLKAVSGPGDDGEHVLTVMLPDED
jgi:hypothetical protein